MLSNILLVLLATASAVWAQEFFIAGRLADNKSHVAVRLDCTGREPKAYMVNNKFPFPVSSAVNYTSSSPNFADVTGYAISYDGEKSAFVKRDGSTIDGPKPSHPYLKLAVANARIDGKDTLVACGGEDKAKMVVPNCLKLSETGTDAFPSLRKARACATITGINNGQPNGPIIVTGGHDQDGPNASVEIFYKNGVWDPNVAPMTKARDCHTAVALNGDELLVCGGRVGNDEAGLGCEIFSILKGQWSNYSYMTLPQAKPNGKDGKLLKYKNRVYFILGKQVEIHNLKTKTSTVEHGLNHQFSEWYGAWEVEPKTAKLH